MLMKPANWKENWKYPVVQYVYGGPGAQLVRNIWNSWSGWQKYTSLGYAILIVDGRGSSNRGLQFEAALKYKMGTIEVTDQVEGLLEVAKKTANLLDLDRVAMFGWSYGGFVSLLALVCIAGGPVTSWALYDTGYTERYMGLPFEQCDAYSNGSVIEQASKFPDECAEKRTDFAKNDCFSLLNFLYYFLHFRPDRLLIVHGLMDENVHFKHTETLLEALIEAGKPYRLQVFPRERHGVRANVAVEGLDTVVLHTLQQGLQVDV